MFEQAASRTVRKRSWRCQSVGLSPVVTRDSIVESALIRNPLNVSWVEPGSDIIECQFGPKYLESYFPVEPAGLASRLLSRMSGAGMNLVSLTFKDLTSCA